MLCANVPSIPDPGAVRSRQPVRGKARTAVMVLSEVPSC